MSIQATTLTRPDEHLRALDHVCRWSERVRLVFAWASSDEGRSPHWRKLPLDKIDRAIIGCHFAQTEPAALRRLALRGDALRVVPQTVETFHPKLLLGLRGDEVRAIVGSANLTTSAFRSNVEVSVLLEGAASEPALAALLHFVDEQWGRTDLRRVTDEWLEQYEALYAKRPRPQAVPVSLARPTTDDQRPLLDHEGLVTAFANRSDGRVLRRVAEALLEGIRAPLSVRWTPTGFTIGALDPGGTGRELRLAGLENAAGRVRFSVTPGLVRAGLPARELRLAVTALSARLEAFGGRASSEGWSYSFGGLARLEGREVELLAMLRLFVESLGRHRRQRRGAE